MFLACGVGASVLHIVFQVINPIYYKTFQLLTKLVDFLMKKLLTLPELINVSIVTTDMIMFTYIGSIVVQVLRSI